MINTKHTPGPWLIYNSINLTEMLIAKLGPGNLKTDIAIVEGRENARLIAAAPELLEACEHAIERLRKLDEYRKTDSSASIGLIERAIAKATGGAE